MGIGYLMKKKIIVVVVAIVAYLYVYPVVNWLIAARAVSDGMGLVVADIASGRAVQVNSMLLPKVKELQLRAFLAKKRGPAIYVIGNSTQFNLSTQALEAGYNCKTKPFFNFSHVGADPFTSRKMVLYYRSAFQKDDIVLWSVHSTLFRLIERVNTESGHLPWRDAEMWWHDMRLGTSSIARLYPLLINIQWPSSVDAVFPIVRYYGQQTDLTKVEKKNFLLRPDGSNLFVNLELEHHRRREKKVRLDADNIRRTAMRIGASRLYRESFRDFFAAISFLSKRVKKIYIYETTYHPVYQQTLRNSGKIRSNFVDFLTKTSNKYHNVEFLNRPLLTREIEDRYWLDTTHLSDRHGSIIARRLSRFVAPVEICINK